MTWEEKIQLVENSGNMGDALDLLLQMEQEIIAREDDVKWLRALEVAGVDNWQGYSYAADIYSGREEV